MQCLLLRCNNTRCNVDNTANMSIEKCIINMKNENGEIAPCYYLAVQESDTEHPDNAWKKFDTYVAKVKGKEAGKDEKKFDKFF